MYLQIGYEDPRSNTVFDIRYNESQSNSTGV